jgi:hypothetical protein
MNLKGKIATAAAAASALLGGMALAATPASAAGGPMPPLPAPVHYQCATYYSHAAIPPPPRSRAFFKWTTTEEVFCNHDFTGQFTISITGGLFRTATVKWQGGDYTTLVPSREEISTYQRYYPEITITEPGDVPASWMPRITVAPVYQLR